MGIFDIWSEFGFRDNPYSEKTLEADEIGKELLVGRESEAKQIQRRIGSNGAHVSVEGQIGVGKTSLINVAVYQMMEECLKRRNGELFVPAVDRFQPESDIEKFEKNFYQVIAQTLIRYKESIESVGLPAPDIDRIDKWLNKSEYRGYGAGITVGPFGGNGSYSSEPNAGEGFSESGFPGAVRQALDRSFPSRAGGIVCILDNLEIVETAGVARARLDELRDRVFNIPQVRWVLCGSRGIVSRARTERLSGIFQSPLIVPPLDDDQTLSAIVRRIEYYGGEDAVVPISPETFEFMYGVLNRNLRESMTTAQGFAQRFYDEYVGSGRCLPPEEERSQDVKRWLLESARRAYSDAKHVQSRVWSFFDALCISGGRAGSSEFLSFDFTTQQQMVSAVTSLVDANLVVREVDPENGTKTVNSVTALGWQVFYFRQCEGLAVCGRGLAEQLPQGPGKVVEC